MMTAREGTGQAAGLPRAGEPLVQLTDVQKRYASGTLALEEISFAVRPGEFVSLVGPSGCGKSTVLRLIAGLGDATSGEIRVNGLPAAQARRECGDLAFVFQDPTLLPWRTVQGNVEFPLELRGVSRARRRDAARQALATVALLDVAGEYPRQLSGGMRMRVSIARALTTRPRLLLMDEPFGALDEITRQRLNGELLRIVALAGWTVVFVTHNVFEAVFLSTRILVMRRRPGRIIGDLTIALPTPRQAEVRTSTAYGGYVGQVIRLLEQAEGDDEE
jgi:NitT/TauT family transport system ATP-binding protein